MVHLEHNKRQLHTFNFYPHGFGMPQQWRIQDFPKVECQPSRGDGAAPTHDFAKISQKLHEIESIWTPRGRGGMRPKFYYVDPPLHKMCLLSCSDLKFKNIVGGVKCSNKFV